MTSSITSSKKKRTTRITTQLNAHDPCYGNKCVDITSPDKILFPKSKITKQHMIEYYEAVAPYMLPYMKSRPLTMQRFPDGITHESFYQKNVPDYFPSWIARKNIPTQEGKAVNYMVCNNNASLVYLANTGCITPHLFLSKIDKLNYPDQMIFDLDPSRDNDFATVKKIAKLLRKELESLGLIPFVKTTGSRGLHVVAPLKREHTFDEVRECARIIAERIVEQLPQHTTTAPRIAERKNKVFIDTLRNSFGATAVAPYAVRAHEKAPVAMPLTWEDLTSSRLQSTSYAIKNALKRLEKKGDAWKDIHKSARSLKKALHLLKK